jgi:HK97 family phage major capsid protein
MPPLQVKNAAANEFRGQADALRKELLDPKVELTKEELEKKVEGIRTLEARAAAAAEFTAEDEITRQGGDDLVRMDSPEHRRVEGKSVTSMIQRYSQEVSEYFGGPNGYLLGMARSRGGIPMTTDQKRVHDALQALGTRSGLAQRAIIGDANDASGGEFLLPLQQVASIFRLDNMQNGLLPYARRYPVSGRTLRIPYLVQTDATDTRPGASIANVTIVGEGDEKPEREPKFLQRLLTVYKYAAYTELGDETLGDDMTGEVASVVQEAVGGQALNKVNEDITIDGSGTAMPLGALHASNGALLVVNRETSQNITTADVFAMYSKLTKSGGRRSAVWLIHPSALPELLSLTLGSNTLVTFLPGLNGAPTMTLLGLPIVESELLPMIGVRGDLALVNGDFYAVALRQVESSIHYRFRNDLTAYRFVVRAGGIPIPTSTYAYKSSGSAKVFEHSPFVVLGDDATS